MSIRNSTRQVLPALAACAIFGLSASFSQPVAATVYCVGTGEELSTALADAQIAPWLDPTFIRLKSGRIARQINSASGVEWRFMYHYRRARFEISGGWNSDCTSQTLDPTLTVLDGRNAKKVLHIDDRSENWAAVYLTFNDTISVTNLTLDRGRSIDPEFGGPFAALNIEVVNALSQAQVIVENVVVTGSSATLGNSSAVNISMTGYTPGGGGLVRVRNNVIHGNNLSGATNTSLIKIQTALGASAAASNNSIFGNVVSGPVAGLTINGLVGLYNSVVVNNSSTGTANAAELYSASASQLRLINNHLGRVDLFGTPVTNTGTTTGAPFWTGTGPFRIPDVGSPLRDSGSNVNIGGPLATDIRGLPRIVNTVVDRGAVEAQPPANTGPTISALEPLVNSTTTLPATDGPTQTTRVFFLTQSGNGTGQSTMNCDVTAGNGAVVVRPVQTVSNGGLALPVDLALDNPVAGNGNVQATLSCEVFRENANVYTLTYFFVVRDPQLFRNGFE